MMSYIITVEIEKLISSYAAHKVLRNLSN